MSFLRNCESIGTFNTFTEAIGEYVDLANRTEAMKPANYEQEQAPSYQAAQAAEDAAHDALLTIIDAFTAAKVAQALEDASEASAHLPLQPRADQPPRPATAQAPDIRPVCPYLPDMRESLYEAIEEVILLEGDASEILHALGDISIDHPLYRPLEDAQREYRRSLSGARRDLCQAYAALRAIEGMTQKGDARPHTPLSVDTTHQLLETLLYFRGLIEGMKATVTDRRLSEIYTDLAHARTHIDEMEALLLQHPSASPPDAAPTA